MKKLLVLLLTAACALCLAFAVAGCKPDGGESSGATNTQQGDTGGTEETGSGSEETGDTDGSDNTDDSGSSDSGSDNTGDTGGSEETGGGNYIYNCSQTEHWQVNSDGEETAHSPHNVANGVCPTCGYVEKCTEGLEFTEIKEGEETIGYEVSRGTATDSDIYIPSFYNGLPVISIGQCAFTFFSPHYDENLNLQITEYYDEDLESIIIGNRVNSIESSAFEGCVNLKMVTLPDSMTSICESAFYYCTNLTDITIPDRVTYIGEWAFYNCDFTELNIPSYVTSIGKGTFGYCTSLKSVTIGKGVTSIGEYAFEVCTNLTSISIPNSVTSIGKYAFVECTNLESVYITDIAAWCNIYVDNNFSANPLWYAHNLYLDNQLVTELTAEMLQGVTKIKDYAFSWCTSLESITIPDSVTSIGESAFENCTNLESVYITDIAAWCNIEFSNYSANPLYYAHNLYLDNQLVTDLNIPQEVTKIKDYAFEDCESLTSITIPENVTSIGEYAFSGCTSFTSITIPNGVTSIRYDAFRGCTSLESVTFNNPNGWYVTKDSPATSGTDIPSEDLQNPETAATYLKDTYRNYNWYRKTT